MFFGVNAIETADENNFQTMPTSLRHHQQALVAHRIGEEPGYKSLHLLHTQNKDTVEEAPPAYMNTSGSDASASVKYYVLEDIAKN